MAIFAGTVSPPASGATGSNFNRLTYSPPAQFSGPSGTNVPALPFGGTAAYTQPTATSSTSLPAYTDPYGQSYPPVGSTTGTGATGPGNFGQPLQTDLGSWASDNLVWIILAGVVVLIIVAMVA